MLLRLEPPIQHTERRKQAQSKVDVHVVGPIYSIVRPILIGVESGYTRLHHFWVH